MTIDEYDLMEDAILYYIDALTRTPPRDEAKIQRLHMTLNDLSRERFNLKLAIELNRKEKEEARLFEEFKRSRKGKR